MWKNTRAKHKINTIDKFHERLIYEYRRSLDVFMVHKCYNKSEKKKQNNFLV